MDCRLWTMDKILLTKEETETKLFQAEHFRLKSCSPLVLGMKLVTTLEQITILRSTALLVGMDMLISFSQQVIQSTLATEQFWGTSMMATTTG